MAVLLVVGLGWRSGHLPFPGFFVKYGGDALWAWLVFLGLTVVFPGHRTLPLAGGALAVAAAVEFLQLYHGPWLEAARSTRLGRLALGTTFSPPDLIAYAVGIALGAAVDLGAVGPGNRIQRRPD